MNRTCCKDCDKRYIGCHGSCEDYKKFKDQKKLENENAKKYKSSAGWDGYNKSKYRR